MTRAKELLEKLCRPSGPVELAEHEFHNYQTREIVTYKSGELYFDRHGCSVGNLLIALCELPEDTRVRITGKYDDYTLSFETAQIRTPMPQSMIDEYEAKEAERAVNYARRRSMLEEVRQRSRKKQEEQLACDHEWECPPGGAGDPVQICKKCGAY